MTDSYFDITDSYFLVTKSTAAIKDTKKAEYIRSMYQYDNKTNQIVLDEYSFCEGMTNTMSTSYTPSDKLIYLLACVLSWNNSYDSQEEANDAAEPITEMIRKYIPEFQGFVFPSDKDSVYIPKYRAYIDLDEPLLIPTRQPDDEIFQWLKNRQIGIDKFVFCKKYMVIEINCNYRNQLATMLRTNIIDRSTIENIDEIIQRLRKEHCDI